MLLCIHCNSCIQLRTNKLYCNWLWLFKGKYFFVETYSKGKSCGVVWEPSLRFQCQSIFHEWNDIPSEAMSRHVSTKFALDPGRLKICPPILTFFDFFLSRRAEKLGSYSTNSWDARIVLIYTTLWPRTDICGSY